MQRRCKIVIHPKEEDSEENTNFIRLKCLDLFHKNCLTQYANKLPNNQKESYTCPTCNLPFIIIEKTSKLENEIVSYLSTSTFANSFFGYSSSSSPPEDSSLNKDSNKPKVPKATNENNISQTTIPTSTVTSRSSTISSILKTGDEIRLNLGNPQTTQPEIEEEDDKYKKKILSILSPILKAKNWQKVSSLIVQIKK